VGSCRYETSCLRDHPSRKATPVPARHARALKLWLAALAALIAAMILVGGTTRLTDSGLSITEWKPIVGAIPPLSASDWNEAFTAYKTIPEYTELKRGMSLEEFKTIYWWEWAHRFLGRLIGFAFLVPFAAFWIAGYIPRALLPRLLGLFVLGGLQGALGWYMVRSGLTLRTDVSQYRLAAHFGVALGILGYTLWLLFGAGGAGPARRGPKRGLERVVLALMVHRCHGALVAEWMPAGLQTRRHQQRLVPWISPDNLVSPTCSWPPPFSLTTACSATRSSSPRSGKWRGLC
jgi:cytochrome c oxidase assembly protein subunit 15